MSANNAPESENIRDDKPPNIRAAKTHLSTEIVIADTKPNKTANMVTIFASPSLTPGMGMIRLVGNKLYIGQYQRK